MIKKMTNRTHIEGIVYEHELEIKVSGPDSTTPNTEFITGTLSIATDNAVTNIVPVHFTYVTAKTKKGTDNATYTVLKGIIDGTIPNYMESGDKAGKVRIDSAIGANEFYTDRSGKEELVSAKRNEGGFVHTCTALNDAENTRNTFECDMVITNVIHKEADEERQLPEKAIIKGFVFDFRNALVPVEFSAVHPGAISYYESLGVSSNNPIFTKVWGVQISETVVRTITEESAWGEPSVREVKNSRRDFVITGSSKELPEQDSEEQSISYTDLKEALAAREVYLATIKQRQDEYKAKKNNAPSIATTPANSAFNF